MGISTGKWPAWHAGLRHYRNSSTKIAIWQLINTLVPYGLLWVAMIWSIQQGYHYGITLAMALIAALFLVRIFILFHDCVHGSLFRKIKVNNAVGNALGVLAFTPFGDWRFHHLQHHASYANLDARGFGDIWTMTLSEYKEASTMKRLSYRLYRNPLILFGLGAVFSFLLRFRIPTQMTRRKAYKSVLFTNLLIAVIILIAALTIGLQTFILIQLPVLWFAGAMGIWLFYVQHQFEGVYWARKEEWDPLRAAMEGSSFYKLPGVLRWFSANIGYHFIHHLSPRIPNYRLKQCYDNIPALRDKPPLTIGKSLSNVSLKLWDEDHEQLVGFP